MKGKDAFLEIRDSIVNQLLDITYIGDLSDLGNEVGIAIGGTISKETIDSDGFELNSFINGVKHGISLTDGTHG